MPNGHFLLRLFLDPTEDERAPGGGRTHTCAILSRMPLPLGYRGESSGGKSTRLLLRYSPANFQAMPSRISDSDATNSAAPVAAITRDSTSAPAVITSTRPGCI